MILGCHWVSVHSGAFFAECQRMVRVFLVVPMTRDDRGGLGSSTVAWAWHRLSGPPAPTKRSDWVHALCRDHLPHTLMYSIPPPLPLT